MDTKIQLTKEEMEQARNLVNQLAKLITEGVFDPNSELVIPFSLGAVAAKALEECSNIPINKDNLSNFSEILNTLIMSQQKIIQKAKRISIDMIKNEITEEQNTNHFVS